jgi:hypothetical protein
MAPIGIGGDSAPCLLQREPQVRPQLMRVFLSDPCQSGDSGGSEGDLG